MVYLITGKAGAGKSTYSKALQKELESEGYEVVILDGDEWRKKHSNNDYSDRGRLSNLMTAARHASALENSGKIIIMAFIAPKKEWRDKMRSMWKRSKLIYLPGGQLWEGSTYERPLYGE